MLLRVTNFSGMLPQVSPKQLPDNAAQIALNTRLTGGALSAYANPVSVGALTKTGNKKTIYRFGQNETELGKYWFSWPNDVDVARGQVAADESERTIFTGDNYVSGKTNYAMAVQQAGNAYPSQQFNIGVAKPIDTLLTTPGTAPESSAAIAAAESAATAASAATAKNDVYKAAVTTTSTAIATTITALTKIQKLTPTAGDEDNSIYIGNSVPAGLETNKVYTSTDAVTWDPQTLPTGRWTDCAYNGTNFCAIDSVDFGGVVISETGVVWVPQIISATVSTVKQPATAGTPVSITWNGTYFIVARYYPGVRPANAFMKSVDGIEWTAVATPPTKACLITAANTSTGLTVAIGPLETSVFTSSGGNSWTNQANKLPSAYWTDLVFDGLNFIAYASKTSLTDPTPRCFVSSDGITWTAKDPYEFEAGTHVRLSVVDGIIYAARKGTPEVLAAPGVEAVPATSAEVYTSSDHGLSWNKDSSPMAWVNALTLTKGMSTRITATYEYEAGVAVAAELDAKAAEATAKTEYDAAKKSAENLAKAAIAVNDSDAASALETRYYVYTYVTAWGEESAPSGASLPVNVRAGQEVKVTGFTVPNISTENLESIRLYRTNSGSQATDWQYVDEIPIAEYSNDYIDKTRAEDLGEIIPSLYWDAPPKNLRGVINLPNGIMAGFVVDDAGNALNDIYFSEPYRPYAWPSTYSLTVGYPVVGLAVIDASLIVLTKGNPYIISGIDPSAMSSQEIDVKQACIAKRSIVSINGTVYYASPDGLVAINSGGTQIVTKTQFTRREWQALNTERISSCQYDGKYFAFYPEGGGFIFDTVLGLYQVHNINASAAFSDLRNDALFLAIDGDIVEWDSAPTFLPYVWRSKTFEAPAQTNFAWGQAFCEGDVTMNVYADGRLVSSHAVTNGVPYRLPSGFLARYWELEAVGTGTVLNMMIAHSMEEIKSV
jgi:hypothetical protein